MLVLESLRRMELYSKGLAEPVDGRVMTFLGLSRSAGVAKRERARERERERERLQTRFKKKCARHQHPHTASAC